MAETKHTPGPWICYADLPSTEPNWHIVTTANKLRVLANVHIEPGNAMDEANARLIAAAPSMADAIMGLISLCQLLRNRDDCPSEIRQALTHNHRIIAGYEALSAAGIDGFQPSDFDLAKAEGSSHD